MRGLRVLLTERGGTGTRLVSSSLALQDLNPEDLALLDELALGIQPTMTLEQTARLAGATRKSGARGANQARFARGLSCR